MTCVAVLRAGSNLRCRSVGVVPTHQGLMCQAHARQLLPPGCCPDCGHQHTSPALGSICIGCDCLSVPAFVNPRMRLT